jgi:hypothetical protein
MTLTLELTPEEARLRTVANGKTLEETVRSLIEQIPNNERAW